MYFFQFSRVYVLENVDHRKSKEPRCFSISREKHILFKGCYYCNLINFKSVKSYNERRIKDRRLELYIKSLPKDLKALFTRFAHTYSLKTLFSIFSIGICSCFISEMLIHHKIDLRFLYRNLQIINLLL